MIFFRTSEEPIMTLRLLTTMALGTGLLCAADQPDAAKRLAAADIAFHEVMGTPDKAIPQDLLNRAQCVIIVPGLKTGAFIFGAKYGKGFCFLPQEGRGGLVGARLRFAWRAAASGSRSGERRRTSSCWS